MPLTNTQLDAIILELPGYDPRKQSSGCTFDHDAARHAIQFFEELLHFVEGKKAGQPFLLERWQKAIVANLFGWKREDGTRRYREVLIYIGKKQGKSAFAAGLLLLLLVADGEQGAQVFSAASTKEQAALIFKPMVGMIRQEPELRSRLRIYGERGGGITRSIVYEATHSSYQCLASDADRADGVNVHAAVIDEVHAHKNHDLSERLRRSTAARQQPVIVYTTTADTNRESLCNTLLKHGRMVCQNRGISEDGGWDPAFLPAIYEADRADDWELESTWRKANPNLGVTVDREFYVSEIAKARDNPSLLNGFLRFHLNIVTDAEVAMIPMDKWDACATPARGNREHALDALAGRECYGGLDLAVKRDMTALTLLFPEDDGGYRVHHWFWIPEASAKLIERRQDVPFSVWARDAWVTITPGNVADYGAVRRGVEELARRFIIRELAYDPYSATEMSNELLEEGVALVESPQTMLKMSEPTGKFVDLIISGKWRHDGSPVARWQAGNVMAYTDRSGRTRPDKARSANKIDGIVAGIMALDRAMAGSACMAWDGSVDFL